MASDCLPGVKHRVGMVPVASKVSLEVLDFGGNGEPVVFLAGLLATAHSYDEFAPALTNSFHVYSITRRGFGASSQPDTGYDIGTRVEDLSRALTALKLDRVNLVGHSQAGDELTWFAESLPDRVARLVYLDAADDHSELSGWFKQNGFFPGMSLPSPAESIWKGSAEAGPPDYRGLKQPALAVYATPSCPADVWPDAWVLGDDAMRAFIRKAFKMWVDMRSRSKPAFAQAPHGSIVEISRASHALHVSDRQEVLDLTRRFLLRGR